MKYNKSMHEITLKKNTGEGEETAVFYTKNIWWKSAGMSISIAVIILAYKYSDVIYEFLHQHAESCPSVNSLHKLAVDLQFCWIFLFLEICICLDEARRRNSKISLMLASTAYFCFTFTCAVGDPYVYIASTIIAALSAYSLWKSLRRNIIRYDKVNDYIGSWRFCDEIIHQIVNVSKLGNKGISIAITGRWGIGKSHCLSYIKYCITHLDANSYRICEADLWQMGDGKDALSCIADLLEKAIYGQGGKRNRLAKYLSQFLQFMLPREIIDPCSRASILDYFLINDRGNETKICARLSNSICNECPESGVVLILDNLERAKDEVIIDLLPLIEKLSRIQRLIVLCSVDVIPLKDRCASSSLPIGAQSLEGYFLKIFDYHFEIPVMDVGSMSRMVKAELRRLHASPKLSDSLALKQLSFDTPRQIQRVVAHLSYIDDKFLSHINDELIPRNDESKCDSCLTKIYRMQWSTRNYDYHTILLTSVLGLIYKPIVSNIQQCKGVREFLSDFEPSLYNHVLRDGVTTWLAITFNIDDDAKKKHEEWKKRYPYTARITEGDILAWSLLAALKYRSNAEWSYAINKCYERLERVEPSRALDFINYYLSVSVSSFYNIFCEYFKEQMPSRIGDSLTFTLSYSLLSYKDDVRSLSFLHSVIRDLLLTATDNEDECQIKDDLKKYISCEVFLFPFVYRYSILRDSKQVALAVEVFTLIVADMPFYQLAEYINKIDEQTHNTGRRMSVKSNRSLEYIDVKERLELPIFVQFLQELRLRYLEQLFKLLDNGDLIHSMETFHDQHLFYPIDNMPQSMFDSSAVQSLLTSSNGSPEKLLSIIALFKVVRFVKPSSAHPYAVASAAKISLAQKYILYLSSSSVQSEWLVADIKHIVECIDSSLEAIHFYLDSEYCVRDVCEANIQRDAIALLTDLKDKMLSLCSEAFETN